VAIGSIKSIFIGSIHYKIYLIHPSNNLILIGWIQFINYKIWMDPIHPTYFKDSMNHFLLVIYYPTNKTTFIKKKN